VRRDVDLEVEWRAGRRAGVFTRDDVTAAGGDKYLVARRERAGRWNRWWIDVFSLASHPASHDQLCWVAVLAAGPGGHLSFEAAAERYGLAGIERDIVAVTTRRSNHIEIPAVAFHQLDDVLPHHLGVVDGFPISTPARTIVDLAAIVSPGRLGVALEDVVVRRLARLGDIRDVLTEVRRHGKPGVAKLVAALDARDGQPPPASELERHLHETAARAGVTLSRQHPLPARPVIEGVVDGVVVESKLILESDGRRWHARMRDMARDRQRDREAARLGWLTLRFVYEDLVHDQRGSADDIAVTHAQRTGGRGMRIPPPSSSGSWSLGTGG
jgi:very-short-patch-repair endonuclease